MHPRTQIPNARAAHLGHVDAGEDGRRLADAGQPLREQLRRQVVQVQVDVVLRMAPTQMRR